jgi:hypothetical protein
VNLLAIGVRGLLALRLPNRRRAAVGRSGASAARRRPRRVAARIARALGSDEKAVAAPSPRCGDRLRWVREGDRGLPSA